MHTIIGMHAAKFAHNHRNACSKIKHLHKAKRLLEKDIGEFMTANSLPIIVSIYNRPLFTDLFRTGKEESIIYTCDFDLVKLLCLVIRKLFKSDSQIFDDLCIFI